MMKSLFLLFFFSTSLIFSQSSCTPVPEVNFPGGRVILSFDGNVHDDDDIIAMPYAAGMWWAAGLKDKVVQVEYSNHICDLNSIENDNERSGIGDDSQNMRESAQGAISRFGYNPGIFYDYETQGAASTSKMAAEIEKSTSSNPLWILAGGPMETVWRGMEQATRGHDNVVIISHSVWNDNHLHCNNAHGMADLKSKYQSRGTFFVTECSGSSCNSSSGLNDQNGGFKSHESNWYWMRDNNKEYNRWLYSRNPFSWAFDLSDAGMSYFLITGGPFNGGNKTGNHVNARNLMDNACPNGGSTVQNSPPSLTIVSPTNGQSFDVGASVNVNLSASDSNGSIIKHEVFVNGVSVDTDGSGYSPYVLTFTTAGTYTIRAEVTDNNGAKTTRTVEVATKGSTPNKPSSFSFVSPQDNQSFNVGSNIPITLSTSNVNGITKHQIYVNGSLVDTDGVSYTPYTISNASAGSYVVRAEVTDGSGEKLIETVNFTVQTSGTPDPDPDPDPDPNPDPSGNSAPTVSFTKPADGQNFNVGSTVSIGLAASDSDGSIVRHQIFVNGKLVDTDGSGFTPHSILNIASGSYAIRADVMDNSGAVTSETINITVGSSAPPPPPQTPSFTFVSPTNNQSFQPGGSVVVNLSTAGMSNVSLHKIYVNDILVDTDGSYFTPHTISSIPSGSHTIRAEVTSNGVKFTKEVIINAASTQKGRQASPKGGSNTTLSVQMDDTKTLFEEKGNAMLQVAPNPVQGNEMKVYQRGNGYIKIVNLQGVVVKEIPAKPIELGVDVTGLPAGLYILMTDLGSTKFIIE